VTLVLGLGSPAFGATKEKAQEGVIGIEGAIVYSAPDFDSPVVGELPPAQKVLISQRVYPGVSGLGAFYKIKVGKSSGYVTDVDVIPQFNRTGPHQTSTNPMFEDVEDARERAKLGQREIYYTRYLGAGFGNLNFSERFSGKTLHAYVPMINFKFSGPGVLFDGPPLDFNFSISAAVPAYYKKFAQTEPTGFLIFSDTQFLMPLAQWQDFLIYYGPGIMWTYTKFRVQVDFASRDSQELRFGVLGGMGAAFRIRRYIARLEAKYYYERSNYVGYWLSVQHEY